MLQYKENVLLSSHCSVCVVSVFLHCTPDTRSPAGPLLHDSISGRRHTSARVPCRTRTDCRPPCSGLFVVRVYLSDTTGMVCLRLPRDATHARHQVARRDVGACHDLTRTLDLHHTNRHVSPDQSGNGCHQRGGLPHSATVLYYRGRDNRSLRVGSSGSLSTGCCRVSADPTRARRYTRRRPRCRDQRVLLVCLVLGGMGHLGGIANPTMEQRHTTAPVARIPGHGGGALCGITRKPRL